MLSRSLLAAAVLVCLSLFGCSSADHGTIDSTRFGLPCDTGMCATGGICANFSSVDSSYDRAFCVTVNPCELVDCNDSETCSATKASPSIVTCSK